MLLNKSVAAAFLIQSQCKQFNTRFCDKDVFFASMVNFRVTLLLHLEVKLLEKSKFITKVMA